MGAGNSQCTTEVQPLKLWHSKARFGVPSEGPEETSLPTIKSKHPTRCILFSGAGDPGAFFLPALRARRTKHGAYKF